MGAYSAQIYDYSGKTIFFKVSIRMNRGENSGAKKIISILSSIFLG